ncbi:MAG: amino acid permease [Rhodobiaceae bacterium]|nr:amino acid permease [Rhodobiaceae bacterium]MCC0050186.1 amino acid permease [Rhodobiaceae bacterium]
MDASSKPAGLRRTLGLPLLVFYGVGVTVGAGIFALIGEITRLAGDAAPISFLLAGLIAALTGLSYAAFASVYPRAAGEAIFVTLGIGAFAGRIVGLAMVATGLLSSAVIALAFAGYVGTLVPVPQPVLALGVIALLGAIACYGVRESVIFAAVITVIELSALIVVIIAGAPLLADTATYATGLTPPTDAASWAAILSGSIIAFFAFIGFEDIENMAEETVDAPRILPRAILWTLGITVVVYVLVSLVAIAVPDRAGLTSSEAPLAFVYHAVTGWSPAPISAIAGIAMTNGILVQIIMAARVLYGMSREGLIHPVFGVAHAKLQTPVRATLTVAAAIAILTVSFELVRLAQVTSLVTLSVFMLVNASLVIVAGRPAAARVLVRARPVAALGALISAVLIASELIRLLD